MQARRSHTTSLALIHDFNFAQHENIFHELISELLIHRLGKSIYVCESFEEQYALTLSRETVLPRELANYRAGLLFPFLLAQPKSKI
jgi:hypothetical protein